MDFGTERWIDAGGTSLQVRSWGEHIGRDVLYWHGVGFTSRGGASRGEAAPQLVRDHRLRVVALDAPGFGGSPALEPARYHPHALADLVPALLDALEPSSTGSPRRSRRRHARGLTLPVLLVADAAATEDDLASFRADVPHAEVIRPRVPGHNVLLVGGAETVRAVGDWLEAR